MPFLFSTMQFNLLYFIQSAKSASFHNTQDKIQIQPINYLPKPIY